MDRIAVLECELQIWKRVASHWVKRAVNAEQKIEILEDHQ